MLNRKFLTKVLGEDFRKMVIAQNKKFVESETLKLKQYATYIVDKHKKDRKTEFKDSKEMCYGYSPIDVIAYVSKDGSIKKSLFEFNSINHFLIENDHDKAVETVICILSQLVSENKKDVACFDIDKIDADAKKVEEEYLKAQEAKTKAQEMKAQEIKMQESDEKSQANEAQTSQLSV